jgi:hypothetical protein
MGGGLAVAADRLAIIAQVGAEPDLALVIAGTVILGIGGRAAPAALAAGEIRFRVRRAAYGRDTDHFGAGSQVTSPTRCD